MTKRLVKVKNTRPDPAIKWWWEACNDVTDPLVQQGAKNYEEYCNVLNPDRRPEAHCLLWSPAKDSLECYQIWYFDSLPYPTPKFLLDWYMREVRELNLQITESDNHQIKSYMWWNVKYRHENNILIDDIEVVNINEVDVWPSDV